MLVTFLSSEMGERKREHFSVMIKENVVIGLPTTSRLGAIGITPTVDITPCEGRYPKMPQNDAGIRIPPIVSTADHHDFHHYQFYEDNSEL